MRSKYWKNYGKGKWLVISFASSQLGVELEKRDTYLWYSQEIFQPHVLIHDQMYTWENKQNLQNLRPTNTKSILVVVFKEKILFFRIKNRKQPKNCFVFSKIKSMVLSDNIF